MNQFLICLMIVVMCLQGTVLGDTPANCTYEDIRGTWQFSVGSSYPERPTTFNLPISASNQTNGKVQITIELKYPDVAVDKVGNKGFWTLIYNQGFEVVIFGRKFFAFSKYKIDGSKVISLCDQTEPGWSHDILGHDWAQFTGKKVKPRTPPKFSQLPYSFNENRLYVTNKDFLSKINSHQSSWKAGYYPEYDGMTMGKLIRRAGGKASWISSMPVPASVSEDVAVEATALPGEFDWRNVNGVDYVSPVRNQGSCGSCYAFSAMGMNEARVRVMTNNTELPVFSPQDIVECSNYSQGCEGGFPYLIGGKYAEDYGLVFESCNPYTGQGGGACTTQKTCQRHYSTRYRYVGGYYGACSEDAMRVALHKNGPVSVSFMVYDDFMHYKGGVYKHTGLTDKFNPFHITNHAVLLVGYGVDKASGLKFWTIKNSWGKDWGESGYFRILRGVDECSVESIAVESFPIF